MKTKLIKTASGMEVRIWEGEEPKHEDYGSTLNFEMDYKSWLVSYKSYPVRSEDEEGFRELAHDSATRNMGETEYERYSRLGGSFDFDLSQGIEIPSERVRIDEYPVQCGGFLSAVRLIKYATLLPEDKEGEGQGDGWVSVDERLPEKAFKDVLVYSRLGIVGLGFYDSEFLRMNSNQSHIGNITHWMPLPKPPIK